MAFRINNTAVTVDPKQINIFNVENESAVKALLARLESLLKETL